MPKDTSFPKDIIQDFFKEFPIEDCRFLLWQMLISSISYDETKSHLRHIFMDFYQQLKELVEANHLVITPEAERR